MSFNGDGNAIFLFMSGKKIVVNLINSVFGIELVIHQGK